jgi:beta-alanine degradation protein BauB
VEFYSATIEQLAVKGSRKISEQSAIWNSNNLIVVIKSNNFSTLNVLTKNLLGKGTTSMTHLYMAILIAFLFSTNNSTKDPVKTDGDKYHVVLENERVRVLEYFDKPGDKTNLHNHPDFVLYALSPFKRKLTFADGKTMSRDFKTGDAVWMKAQIHIAENIGQTDTHVLIVELKEPAKK